MKNRKIIVLATTVAALGLLVLLAVQEGRPSATDPSPAPPPDFDIGIPTAQEVRSLVEGYGQRLGENETHLRDLRRELSALRTGLEEAIRTQSVVIEELRREPLEPGRPGPAGDLPRFRKFDFGERDDGRNSLVIPAGSFGEATLLTGVYAPVNDEPLPVLLRLDAALVGPARSRIPIRDAFVVGKALGDANSERAVIQLQTLSYVPESGKAVEIPVNGWVIDRDGIQGLQGTYVWRAEEIAGLAVVTGGLSGAAEALAGRETTTSASPLGASTAVTGDTLRFAGMRAGSSALAKISEIVTRRMEEIVPAVYVANGKRVTISLVTGAVLTGLAPEETRDGSSRRPFDGLDADR